MTDKERIARTKSMTFMFTCFGQGNEAERIVAYVEMLKDIPADVLDKVCKKSVYEFKYLPSIAELLSATRNLQGEMMGIGTLPWAEAWQEIEREMKETFVYGRPKFSRKEIKDTVDAFGWNELCNVLQKDLPIVRAQLRDMYNSICEESRKSEVNAHVLGKEKLLSRKVVGLIE